MYYDSKLALKVAFNNLAPIGLLPRQVVNGLLEHLRKGWQKAYNLDPLHYPPCPKKIRSTNQNFYWSGRIMDPHLSIWETMTGMPSDHNLIDYESQYSKMIDEFLMNHILTKGIGGKGSKGSLKNPKIVSVTTWNVTSL